jgi:hypothetical protein
MKRLLTLWFFSLLMLTSASAQNNLVITDSIFEAEMQGFINAPKPTYLLCIDSLIKYVRDNYGDNTKCASSSLYKQVMAPVSGSDEILRRVTSHIIKQLSRFSHLQQYSELKDEKNNLQGRYIVKFRPEGNDTSAYAFLKYDRNLILLRYSRNLALESPKKAAPTPNPIDEELSLWHQLKNRFEIICMGDIDVKYQFRSYRKGPKPFFLTTPAPAVNSRTKMELLRIKDKGAFQFNFLCGYMELAGREEGTINGKLMNDNRFLINKDTCHYFYACHTFSNGLSEFIGVTHEDSITYLVRATSEKPGLCVNHWGKTNWMTPEEIKAITISDYQHLGVWVYDAETKKSINKAKLTTTDDEGNVLDLSEPYPDTPWADRLIYRYHCVVQRQSHYKIKIEAEGYETAYAKMTVKEDENGKQIEVYLKPNKSLR